MVQFEIVTSNQQNQYQLYEQKNEKNCKSTQLDKEIFLIPGKPVREILTNWKDGGKRKTRLFCFSHEPKAIAFFADITATAPCLGAAECTGENFRHHRQIDSRREPRSKGAGHRNGRFRPELRAESEPEIH